MPLGIKLLAVSIHHDNIQAHCPWGLSFESALGHVSTLPLLSFLSISCHLFYCSNKDTKSPPKINIAFTQIGGSYPTSSIVCSAAAFPNNTNVQCIDAWSTSELFPHVRCAYNTCNALMVLTSVKFRLLSSIMSHRPEAKRSDNLDRICDMLNKSTYGYIAVVSYLIILIAHFSLVCEEVSGCFIFACHVFCLLVFCCCCFFHSTHF